MSFWDILGAWVSVGLTLFIFSFLYKDNVFYKIAEHLYIGVTLGYTIAVAIFKSFIPKLWEPLFLDGNILVIVPAILGILILTRMSRKYSWVSRISFACIMGFGAGVAIPVSIASLLLKQTESTVVPVIIRQDSIELTNGEKHHGDLLVKTDKEVQFRLSRAETTIPKSEIRSTEQGLDGVQMKATREWVIGKIATETDLNIKIATDKEKTEEFPGYKVNKTKKGTIARITKTNGETVAGTDLRESESGATLTTLETIKSFPAERVQDATVTLKSGESVTGHLARWDDQAIVLGTAQGEKTYVPSDVASVTELTLRGDVASSSRKIVEMITNLIIIAGVISVLIYFLFSVEHKGVVGKIATGGTYFLMIYFGASFGATVMGRYSLLYGRFYQLYKYRGEDVGYATPVMLLVMILVLFVIEMVQRNKHGGSAPPTE